MKFIKLLLFALMAISLSSCIHEDLNESSLENESILQKRLGEDFREFEMYMEGDEINEPSSRLLLTQEQFFNLRENSLIKINSFEGNENLFFIPIVEDDIIDPPPPPYVDCDMQMLKWTYSAEYHYYQEMSNKKCQDFPYCHPCFDDYGNIVAWYLFYFYPNNGCDSWYSNDWPVD